MTDIEKKAGCVSTPGSPATESTSLGLWAYVQRLVVVLGLLSLLCTANYFLGAEAYHGLNACVDCFVAESQRDKFTEAEEIDAGYTLGGMGWESISMLAFTWFVFQGKNRTRKVVIYVCGLLNVLQRLVFYLEQSGEITRLQIGRRCFLWVDLSLIHVLAFSANHAISQLFFATSTGRWMSWRLRSCGHITIAISRCIGLTAGMLQFSRYSDLMLDYMFAAYVLSGGSLLIITYSIGIDYIDVDAPKTS